MKINLMWFAPVVFPFVLVLVMKGVLLLAGVPAEDFNPRLIAVVALAVGIFVGLCCWGFVLPAHCRNSYSSKEKRP